jgi:hypothetical protein
VKSTSEVKNRELDRFRLHYRAWACGDGTWPRRVPLGRPTNDALAGSLRPIKDWVADWRAWNGGGTIEWAPRRTILGPVSCPSAVVFDGPDDIAALTEATKATWTVTCGFLSRLEAEWPGSTDRARPILSQVVEMDVRDQQRLIDVCRWLHANPNSGLFLRQVPVEGIDTKWIESHKGLVATLLRITATNPDPRQPSNPADDDAIANFQERLGLRRTPQLINVVLCDDALRKQYQGARTLALTATDLAAMTTIPRTVLIIENKETGYAVPDRDGLLAIHGLGLNLKALADIEWLRKSNVLYWGDIDAAGFEWLNNLRGYGVPAGSLLMDESIIDEYRHLSTKGALPTHKELLHLTRSEAVVYTSLRDERWGRRFLLEQERLPWPACLAALDAALARPRVDGAFYLLKDRAAQGRPSTIFDR